MIIEFQCHPPRRPDRIAKASRRITWGLLLGMSLGTVAVAQTIPGCQSGETSASHNNDALPPAGGGERTDAWLSHIAAELRQLHLEVLEGRQEILQNKMNDLGLELQVVQGRQQQDQRLHAQELAEVEAQLAQPNLAKAEREDLENRRVELLANSANLRSPQSPLAQQEAQARERLTLLRQRFQLLAQQVQGLAPGR